MPDKTWANYDDVSYDFAAAEVVDATPDGDDMMTLSVRLLYVINTPEYLQFLVDENQSNMAGMTAFELYEGLGSVVPLELASWSQTVPLTGLVPAASGSTGDESGPGTSGVTTTGEVPTTGGVGSTGGAASTSSGESTGGEAGEGGCGCRGGSGAAGLLWGPLLLLGRRSRRGAQARGCSVGVRVRG